jgi:hypothetical protein
MAYLLAVLERLIWGVYDMFAHAPNVHQQEERQEQAKCEYLLKSEESVLVSQFLKAYANREWKQTHECR